MWDIYECYLLHHREAVLRGMGISGSVVFHFATYLGVTVVVVVCFAVLFFCVCW